METKLSKKEAAFAKKKQLMLEVLQHDINTCAAEIEDILDKTLVGARRYAVDIRDGHRFALVWKAGKEVGIDFDVLNDANDPEKLWELYEAHVDCYGTLDFEYHINGAVRKIKEILDAKPEHEGGGNKVEIKDEPKTTNNEDSKDEAEQNGNTKEELTAEDTAVGYSPTIDHGSDKKAKKEDGARPSKKVKFAETTLTEAVNSVVLKGDSAETDKMDQVMEDILEHPIKEIQTQNITPTSEDNTDTKNNIQIKEDEDLKDDSALKDDADLKTDTDLKDDTAIVATTLSNGATAKHDSNILCDTTEAASDKVPDHGCKCACHSLPCPDYFGYYSDIDLAGPDEAWDEAEPMLETGYDEDVAVEKVSATRVLVGILVKILRRFVILALVAFVLSVAYTMGRVSTMAEMVDAEEGDGL